MRVNQPVNHQIQGSDLSKARSSERASGKEGAQKSGRAGEGRIEGSVKAEISPRAKEFAHAKSVASSSPDVREDKIAELKARIAAGTYKVDAEKVAERMVKDHAEMSAAGLG